MDVHQNSRIVLFNKKQMKKYSSHTMSNTRKKFAIIKKNVKIGLCLSENRKTNGNVFVHLF